MKLKKLKIFMAILLVTASLAGCAAPYTEKKAPQKNTGTVAAVSPEVGEIADYFMKASEGYAASPERSAVIEGMEESDKATRLQMLVLASRAFGRLPAPKGNAKRIAPPAPDLKEVPDWAKEDLQNLSDGGILAASDLTGTSDGEEEKGAAGSSILEEPVTMKDAEIISARFYAAFGTDLKDDFYTAVNQQQLNTIEIPEGEEMAGGSTSVTKHTDEQLKELILEIVNSEEDYIEGSPEQKIRTLYRNYENMDSRDQAGIEPLQKYLDAVDHAASFSELNAAIAQSVLELGNFANGLIPGIPVTDTKDSSRKVLQLMTQVPGLTKEDYEKPDGDAYKEYRNSIIEQLLAVGESREKAEAHADGILKLEKDLVDHMQSQDASGKIKEPKYYTPETLDEMMPQAKLSQLVQSIGLSQDVKMIVFDDVQFASYAKWFTEDNLEIFKAIEKMALLTGYSSYLSSDLAEKFGTAGISSADIAVQNFLSDELGQLYTQRYFPAESKAEIEKMVTMLTDTFKDRINRLDWLEASSKKEALKKLDSITVLIGYPDEWNLNEARFRGTEEGGSYFENVAASEAEKWKRQIEELEKPVDPRRFPLAAYTVNAAASRNTNTIIFPAGILQAPFYDKTASFETNLGSIGSTIAHEITHMFDDGGAQYDAQGNVRDWWTNEDYTHFEKLCSNVVEYYDGYEAAPGIKANAQENLSENIADIGGIACGLELLSKMENPDYDAFFRSYANQWLRAADYSILEEMAESDIHAPNNLRCNRVLANFQEFYDTYGIKEGDGMYVPKEERVAIW